MSAIVFIASKHTLEWMIITCMLSLDFINNADPHFKIQPFASAVTNFC